MSERQLTTDSRFRYRGPTSGATLRVAGNLDREVMFHDGQEYLLPGDHRHIKRLVAQGYLTPIDEPAKAKTPAPTPTTRTPRGSKAAAASSVETNNQENR